MSASKNTLGSNLGLILNQHVYKRKYLPGREEKPAEKKKILKILCIKEVEDTRVL